MGKNENLENGDSLVINSERFAADRRSFKQIAEVAVTKCC